MNRHLFVVFALAGAVMAAASSAAPPGAPGVAQRSARDMYAGARAREQVIRSAWASARLGPAPVVDVKQVRTVVAAYEEVVRAHPTSGYCDDALWRAGGLAAEAFARFQQDRDRRAAALCYAWLSREYPKSPFAARAVAKARRLAALPPSRPARARTAGGSSPGRVAVGTSPPARTVPRVPPPALTVSALLPARTFARLSWRLPRAAPRHVAEFAAEDVPPAKPARGARPAALSAAPVADRPAPAPAVVRLPPLAAWTIPSASLRTLPYVAPHALPAASSPDAAPPETPGPAPAAAGRTPELPPGTFLAPPAVPPSVPARGFSMARQLGLGVSRLVIDPGHGGRDPGAEHGGVVEAELVLDIALRLEALLRRQPGLEVLLTRRSDETVPLEERVAFANREQADLFISIHANAHRDARVQGVETYVLDFASTREAAAVAARENAASSRTMSNLPQVVKAIALTNKLDESREFAASVNQALVRRLRPVNRSLRDLGVKRAPFVVLIGAEMPSILVEVSFLTNPREARLLRGDAYRQRIAEALLDGVQRYQRALKRARPTSQ